MMESGLTNWGDLLVFGVFLFFLGIGWTFGRCYSDFYKECDSKSRNEIMEALFVRSTVEAAAILGFAGLVLLLGMLRREMDLPLEGSRWSIWFAWVPFLVYAVCRLAEDRWAGLWRRVSRLCLAGTFLCQFVALSAHMHRFPPGTDRAMYEPQCLLVLVATGITITEVVVPLKRRMRWVRPGCTMVQGTWYVQIGFTLCVSGREWQLEDNVTMTVVFIFLWHCALSSIIIHFVRKTVRSALCAEPYIQGDFESCDEDFDVDNIYDDEQIFETIGPSEDVENPKT
ncbi:uncharacterized protein LOC110974799 [Acanthaster planci]|uniref:Uncharacterized protein LOC110974799 n=1 Tax=Acanthaster planci TaxID=133434 RepID=A0A8B7XNI4_ACAPL|nr:uncharacterized protein LOC110974799 [Acanthaster planci]